LYVDIWDIEIITHACFFAVRARVRVREGERDIQTDRQREREREREREVRSRYLEAREKGNKNIKDWYFVSEDTL
jgi:hypothetical protein